MGTSSPLLLAGFYHFAPLPDFEQKREPLRQLCERLGLRGSILLAAEGVNASIAGEEGALQEMLSYVQEWSGFEQLTVRYDVVNEYPFKRLKIKLKNEIVVLRSSHKPMQESEAVQHVGAEQWEALMARDDVPVIDTRNDFEVATGSFKGAIDPKTKKFSEFVDWAKAHVDPDDTPEVAMFCTGGIRCEKAATVLHEMGVEKVYQLEGGILQYFRDAGEARANGHWDGDCFVFDERMALNTAMQPVMPDAPEHFHVRMGLDKKIKQQS